LFSWDRWSNSADHTTFLTSRLSVDIVIVGNHIYGSIWVIQLPHRARILIKVWKPWDISMLANSGGSSSNISTLTNHFQIVTLEHTLRNLHVNLRIVIVRAGLIHSGVVGLIDIGHWRVVNCINNARSDLTSDVTFASNYIGSSNLSLHFINGAEVLLLVI
jgi:hypothetical protein